VLISIVKHLLRLLHSIHEVVGCHDIEVNPLRAAIELSASRVLLREFDQSLMQWREGL